jgi:hypothetical protein
LCVIYINKYLGFIINRSRDSAAGIATGYGLDDRGVGVRVLVGSRIFYSHFVESDPGVHPTFYPMDTGGFFPGGKEEGHEAERKLQSN